MPMAFPYELGVQSHMLKHGDLIDFIRRPLFDGDPLYPMTAADYYEWHKRLASNAPVELEKFILGYLHGTDEQMLSFRRAGWDAPSIADFFTDIEMAAGYDEWLQEQLGYEELNRRSEVGVRRASVVASFGREQATKLALSGLSHAELVDIAESHHDARDIPTEYLDALCPPVPAGQWDW